MSGGDFKGHGVGRVTPLRHSTSSACGVTPKICSSRISRAPGARASSVRSAEVRGTAASKRAADDSEGAIDSAASRACKATMRPRQVKGDSKEGECAHGGNRALYDHPII